MSTTTDEKGRSINAKSVLPISSANPTDTEGETALVAKPIPHILVVDDDEMICQQLERLYTHSRFSVTVVNSGEEALKRLEKEDIDLVVTDLKLPGISGVELTKQIQETYPDVPIIVVTGYADIDNTVKVLKLGASDFIVKPFSAAAIQGSTRIVLEKAQPFIEIRHLRRVLKDSHEFGGMLSRNPEMHRVFEIIRTVASTDMTVLIEGETGTGKELVARAIHYLSPKGKGPLIAINCAGLPDTLLESELFGYERGAFTGADQPRAGKIELAHGGTLFLDEIESTSLSMQAKLLRVLEDRKVVRLGSSKAIPVDMRVIAASNVALEDLVEQGKMRSDFYFRINVVPIRLLPLCQRREDIPLLVQDFFRHHPVVKRKRITGVSRPAMNRLIQYHWPGNIRELQNVLERAIVLARGRIIEKVELGTKRIPEPANNDSVSTTVTLDAWLKEQERQYLIRQLEAFGGKIGLTARSCGVGIRTLSRKLRLYGLDKKTYQHKASETLIVTKSSFAEKRLGNS